MSGWWQGRDLGWSDFGTAGVVLLCAGAFSQRPGRLWSGRELLRVAFAVAAGALATLLGCQNSAEAVEIAVSSDTTDVRVSAQSAQTAYASPTGQTYHVAQSGSDQSPGTEARPWRTISHAAAVLRPGDAVLIREGTYRETVRPPRGGTGPEARITYAAYPGETVVISGADPADGGWTPAGAGAPRGAWRRAYAAEDANPYSDDWHFRRPLVIAQGRVLRPVEALRDLVPGTFTVEGPAERPTAVVAVFAQVRTPRQAGPVEVAVRTYGFQPLGPDPYAPCGDPSTPGWLRLVGVTVRHTTNRAQWGAVCAGSRGGLIESVSVEWTVGLGIDTSGRAHRFRDTRADDNGQLGWGGACRSCLFEDTQAVGNNWKGHDPFWEAGGGKWVGTSQSVWRRHYAARNAGPGLWLDGDNSDNTIEGCRLVGNAAAGIMLELNTVRTLVQHNLVEGSTGLAWTGSGILSQAASQNVYVHNTVVGSAGTGLWLRLDPDGRAPDGGNLVANNWIVGNAREAGREAREVQIEAQSASAMHTTRFAGNVYGTVGGDGTYRSTFYAYPDGSEAGLRTDDLRAWQRLVGDTGASLAAGLPDGRRARAPGAIRAGAPGAPFIPSGTVGARPDLVCAPR